jgi:hypothetical protein
MKKDQKREEKMNEIQAFSVIKIKNKIKIKKKRRKKEKWKRLILVRTFLDRHLSRLDARADIRGFVVEHHSEQPPMTREMTQERWEERVA